MDQHSRLYLIHVRTKGKAIAGTYLELGPELLLYDQMIISTQDLD